MVRRPARHRTADADLSDHGFVLEGGRLDYLDGHPAAALVYRKGRHLINLFVWSDPAGTEARQPAAPHLVTRQGYALLRWTAGGLAFCAVSDINAADLQAFQERFAAATPKPEPGS